jgi:hypothetical protein
MMVVARTSLAHVARSHEKGVQEAGTRLVMYEALSY